MSPQSLLSFLHYTRCLCSPLHYFHLCCSNHSPSLLHRSSPPPTHQPLLHLPLHLFLCFCFFTSTFASFLRHISFPSLHPSLLSSTGEQSAWWKTPPVESRSDGGKKTTRRRIKTDDRDRNVSGEHDCSPSPSNICLSVNLGSAIGCLNSCVSFSHRAFQSSLTVLALLWTDMTGENHRWPPTDTHTHTHTHTADRRITVEEVCVEGVMVSVLVSSVRLLPQTAGSVPPSRL